MEYSFMLCGLLLSLISLTLIHFLFAMIINRNENKKKPGLPPGRTGLPLIGETFEFLYNMWEGHPEKFVFSRMAKYSSSEVFTTSLLGAPTVVLCSTAGTKLLFSDANKLFKTYKAASVRKVVTGDEKGEILHGKPAVVEFLKMENLQKLVPIMDSMAQEHLKTHWHGQVVVAPTVKLYTIALACRIILSIEDVDVAKGMLPLLGTIISGIISVPINVPGTAFNRAIKESKVLRKQIGGIVKDRKAQSSSKHKYKNYLSCLFDSGLSDKDIASAILGLFVAANETNEVITLTLMALSDFPDAYQKIYEENMEVAAKKSPEEALNSDDIKQLRCTWNFVREVMRIYPPTPGVFREVIKDFSYAGYRIPKGVKIFSSNSAMHKDPRYFPNPETFDPSRFEGTGPAPYTYFPFGGGLNVCSGRVYAQMVVLTFIHNVVKCFRWEKVHPDEKVVMRPIPTPSKGLPITLHPHHTHGSH